MTWRVRVRRHVGSLVRWFRTVTGLVYLGLVVVAIVAFVVRPVAAIPVVVVMLATIIPYKFARMERSRRDTDRLVGVLQNRVADLERGLERADRAVAETLSAYRVGEAELSAALGELRQAQRDVADVRAGIEAARREVVDARQDAAQARELADRAHAEARDARQDAMIGVDTARSEWVDILRAERRRLTSTWPHDMSRSGVEHVGRSRDTMPPESVPVADRDVSDSAGSETP